MHRRRAWRLGIGSRAVLDVDYFTQGFAVLCKELCYYKGEVL